MTIITSASPDLLTVGEVRPGSRSRMLQQLKRIHQTQCYIYERLLNRTVPVAAGRAVGQAHDHSGSGAGVIIPIALAHGRLDAVLSTAPGALTGVFSPFLWCPIYVPPGITELRIVLDITSGIEAVLREVRVSAHDDAMVYTTQNEPFEVLAEPARNAIQVYADVAVTPGVENMIKIDAWDDDAGYQTNGAPIIDRGIGSWRAYPKVTPRAVPPWFATAMEDATVIVPATTQHLGVHSFTSFDDSMFDDDMAVSAYILTRLSMNAAMLWELATGVPVVGLPKGHTNLVHYRGHNHVNEVTAGLKDGGVDICHTLLTSAFGVMRGTPVGGGGHLNYDAPGATYANWYGRINAPTLVAGAAATYYRLADFKLRVPGATTANAEGIAAKINVSAWVYSDNSKSGGATLEASLGTAAGSFGTVRTAATVAGAGRQMLRITGVGLPAAGSGKSGVLATLRIRARETNAPPTQGFGIYGITCFYEA